MQGPRNRSRGQGKYIRAVAELFNLRKRR